MTFLPASKSVGVRAYSEGTKNALNDAAPSWAQAASKAVYGWAPAGTSEPFEAARGAVTWDLDLLVPPSFTCDPRDRIVVPGFTQEFEVDGQVQQYNDGPFGFTPGGIVHLKAVAG